jgi:hypothetical protein
MPVVDVLQFVYASRRSGVLRLESQDRRGFIAFRDGNIIQATTNVPANTLGSILIAQGALSEEGLTEAIAAQNTRYKGQPLGRILAQMGLVPEAAVKRAVIAQIEAAVLDFVLWLEGTFTFELGGAPVSPDGVAVPVEGLLPGINVDTQHLLLECIRIFDEKNRPAPTPPGPRPAAKEIAPPGEIEAPTPPSHVILLYSDNKVLYSVLASIADKKRVDCRVFRSFSEVLFAAERFVAEDKLPAIVLDMKLASGSQLSREPARAATLATKLLGVHPALEVICLLNQPDAAFRLALLEARARAVITVPPAPLLEEQPPSLEVRVFYRELWTAVLEAFRTYELVLVREQWRRRISSLESYLLKLKKFVRDAQRSNFTFLASLDLLNLIAENYERAVLFLVRENAAGGIGGFGEAADGTPLGIVSKKLVINLREPSVFKTVVERRTTFQGKPDEGVAAHGRLYGLIGRPANGEAMVIPLLSEGRVLAMIYCDNGRSAGPLVYDELLDLLSNQTSILYEKMLAESLPRPAGAG